MPHGERSCGSSAVLTECSAVGAGVESGAAVGAWVESAGTAGAGAAAAGGRAGIAAAGGRAGPADGGVAIGAAGCPPAGGALPCATAAGTHATANSNAAVSPASVRRYGRRPLDLAALIPAHARIPSRIVLALENLLGPGLRGDKRKAPRCLFCIPKLNHPLYPLALPGQFIACRQTVRQKWRHRAGKHAARTMRHFISL